MDAELTMSLHILISVCFHWDIFTQLGKGAGCLLFSVQTRI